MVDLLAVKDWETIRYLRKDMSDFVLHCTRGRRPATTVARERDAAFAVLKRILADGYLKATFAERTTHLAGNRRRTVAGPFPAVCFTDQPLTFFRQSVFGNQRYTRFAIAVRKDDLFEYGGRPAIYSDPSTVDLLDDKLKYLHAHYNPTALWERAYPIDWTHEREWRARPSHSLNCQMRLPENRRELCVPIHLPSAEGTRPKRSHFYVMVDTAQRRDRLVRWIVRIVPKLALQGGYLRLYAAALLETTGHIIALSEIGDEDGKFQRMEDFAKDTSSWLHYQLYQRRLLTPYQASVIHLSKGSSDTLCGVTCSRYSYVGRVSQPVFAEIEWDGFAFCRRCLRTTSV